MRRDTSCFFLALLLYVDWLLIAYLHREASAAPTRPLFGPSRTSTPSETVQTGPWANTPYYLDPEYEHEHPWGAFFTRLAITFDEVNRRASPSVSAPSPK